MNADDEIGQIAKNFSILVRRETLQESTELEALQYQINPHFIPNPTGTFRMRPEITGEDGTATQHRAVGQAKAFVAEHYHEQHTMQDVADRMGMSYAYFSTLFKQQTGETYSGYLTRIRMEEAARLLDAGLPVSKVAGRVGYLYPKHFTRAFKRFQGQTPQQYTAGQAAPHAPDDCRPTP